MSDVKPGVYRHFKGNRYEVFHGVKIHDGALIAAATLSDRYISDRSEEHTSELQSHA